MKTNCKSCGIPIENGCFCGYCTDDAGNLQAFEERFERMVQWTLRQGESMSQAHADDARLARPSRPRRPRLERRFVNSHHRAGQ
jgi:hypothetical protein